MEQVRVSPAVHHDVAEASPLDLRPSFPKAGAGESWGCLFTPILGSRTGGPHSLCFLVTLVVRI
jgi:hypothetical protein